MGIEETLKNTAYIGDQKTKFFHSNDKNADTVAINKYIEEIKKETERLETERADRYKLNEEYEGLGNLFEEAELYPKKKLRHDIVKEENGIARMRRLKEERLAKKQEDYQ